MTMTTHLQDNFSLQAKLKIAYDTVISPIPKSMMARKKNSCFLLYDKTFSTHFTWESQESGILFTILKEKETF
jgi:hypothetical protein